MMEKKEITSYADIEIIISNRLNVEDSWGYIVVYEYFINMPLMQINHIVNKGSWSYYPIE